MSVGLEDGRALRANSKRETRRAEILSAALRVFGSKGYYQAHISDIIEEAGIARGTFYLYFDSKSSIFLELLDDLLLELRQSIVGVETGPEQPPIEAQLIEIVRKILNTVAENRLLTAIIVREAVGLGEEVDARLRAFYTELSLYIEKTLVEGKRMGILRDFDTEIAAMCIIGTIKQFMETLVLIDHETHIDIDQMALKVLDFNLRGILASV